MNPVHWAVHNKAQRLTKFVVGPINIPGFGGWGWLLDSNWCLYSQYFSVPCIISDFFSLVCRCYVWNQRFWIIFLPKQTGNEKLGLLMSMSKIDWSGGTTEFGILVLRKIIPREPRLRLRLRLRRRRCDRYAAMGMSFFLAIPKCLVYVGL